MVLTEAAPGFFRSVEKVAGKHFIVSLGSNSKRNSYLAFPFVPAAPLEWNTPPPSAYHIAFEFIASLSAFPDGSSCFTLVMRASRHVFMSLEDFFGGQDTFVSDQTSERPPFRRARNTRRGIFSPTRFKQRLIVSLKRLPRTEKPSLILVPTRRISSTLWSTLSPVFVYFRVPEEIGCL